MRAYRKRQVKKVSKKAILIMAGDSGKRPKGDSGRRLFGKKETKPTSPAEQREMEIQRYAASQAAEFRRTRDIGKLTRDRRAETLKKIERDSKGGYDPAEEQTSLLGWLRKKN
jgi:hypothetical protein